MRINKFRIGIFIVLGLIILSLQYCKKEKETGNVNTDIKQVEKTIIASEGGTLSISDSTKLFILPNALQLDGNVFMGYTGDEPTSIPNKNLEIVGHPLTLRFPSGALEKSVQLILPRLLYPIDTTTCLILMYNGKTFFPVEYSLSNLKVNIFIDKINWESNNSKGFGLGDIIIIVARKKQIPTSDQLGLNKVSIDVGGNLTFNEPTANSNSKILLLIHGWTGDASSWITFIPKIIREDNPKYSEIWTFVYNSSLGISDNALTLSNLLSKYSKGAQIDIVAHSMGGLVARSMMEQHDGKQYINKLVTLGTPHEGSPLAILRSFFGILAGAGDPLDYIIYNYNTQGFRDLNINSNFLTNLNRNLNPKKLYYAIASTNNLNATPQNDLEKGYLAFYLDLLIDYPNDGMVTSSSAKGVEGAISPNLDIPISAILAHMLMTKYDAVYAQTLDYLRSDIPIVTTNLVTNLLKTGATVSGNVISDGGSTITEIGVYWGLLENPESTGNKVQIGTDIGKFSFNLSGLTPNTTYYVKAYAINSQGTAYGNQVSFTTKSVGQAETVSDIEGNVYKTVTIDTQTWMAENLKVTKYNNSLDIQNVTDNTQWGNLTTGSFCWYNNSISNKDTYGALYNWYTVNTGNLCPTGWHVPSNAEWASLETFLIANGYNYDGTTSGNKIAKSLASITIWGSSINIGTVGNPDYPNVRNITGFNALPGGYRFENDGFQWINLYGVWWSSTESSNLEATTRSIYFDWDDLRLVNFVKKRGFSIRCLKDN